MAHLVVKDGPSRGTSFVLESARVSIGRDPANDIQIPDGRMSRHHAEIRTADGSSELIDLGSRNGTRVSRKDHGPTPIKTQTLEDGDLILIGGTALEFVADVPLGLLARAGDEDTLEGTEFETLTGDQVALVKPSAPAAETSVLEQANRRLVALYDLARVAGAARSMPELVQGMTEVLTAALEADRVYAIVERDGRLVPLRAAKTGFARRLDKVPISTSVVEAVRAHAVSVLSSSTADDERFREAQSIHKARIHSAVCAPITAADGPLGYLYADRLGGGEGFVRDDLELATAAAAQIGVAMENVRFAEQLRERNRKLTHEVRQQCTIVGDGPAIQEVFEFIERAAPTNASVLILGESGTGKELVAHAIHDGSPRCDEAFEVVNCAALTESLVESELFGHVMGAFTGATGDRAGRFELAHGGTIFLDEIGDLPESCQSKLLRVLEQGEVVRVGESRVRLVDVRVVAATNRELHAAVSAGQFREDLFFRLNVLQVRVPALRERIEDLPSLLDHFVAIIGPRCHRPQVRFAPEAVGLMKLYHWPGNIREIRNVVERLIVLNQSDVIGAEDLPREITGVEAAGPIQTGEPLTLAEMERRHILATLQRTGGNKKQAASLLGIDRSTLYAKLRNYGEV